MMSKHSLFALNGKDSPEQREVVVDNVTTYVPVLQDISILIEEGSVWGICSVDPEETKILCRMIANGKANTKNHKISTKTDEIYLNSHAILFDNMTVLEYLMFVTNKKMKEDTITRQIAIIEDLTNLKLDYIALTQIKNILPEEGMLIAALAAIYAKCKLLILDLTSYQLSHELIKSLKRMIKTIRNKDTAIVVGTIQPKLIGICCVDTVFLHEGKERYVGAVETLYETADRVLYVLGHYNAKELYEKLVHALPCYEYSYNKRTVLVLRRADQVRDDQFFYQQLAQHNIIPEVIKINLGRVENSFEELMEYHDIQN